MGKYDVMQVCLNGHLITASFNQYPSMRNNQCPNCGLRTITTCPECGTDIPGEYISSFPVGFRDDIKVPSNCHNCGASFPWNKKAGSNTKISHNRKAEENGVEKKLWQRVFKFVKKSSSLKYLYGIPFIALVGYTIRKYGFSISEFPKITLLIFICATIVFLFSKFISAFKLKIWNDILKLLSALIFIPITILSILYFAFGWPSEICNLFGECSQDESTRLSSKIEITGKVYKNNLVEIIDGVEIMVVMNTDTLKKISDSDGAFKFEFIDTGQTCIVQIKKDTYKDIKYCDLTLSQLALKLNRIVLIPSERSVYEDNKRSKRPIEETKIEYSDVIIYLNKDMENAEVRVNSKTCPLGSKSSSFERHLRIIKGSTVNIEVIKNSRVCKHDSVYIDTDVVTISACE